MLIANIYVVIICSIFWMYIIIYFMHETLLGLIYSIYSEASKEQGRNIRENKNLVNRCEYTRTISI